MSNHLFLQFKNELYTQTLYLSTNKKRRLKYKTWKFKFVIVITYSNLT